MHLLLAPPNGGWPCATSALAFAGRGLCAAGPPVPCSALDCLSKACQDFPAPNQAAMSATLTSRLRAALFAALACCLLAVLSLGSAASAAAGSATVVLPYGVHLEELPGFASVQGGPGWPKDVSITLLDVPVQVCGWGCTGEAEVPAPRAVPGVPARILLLLGRSRPAVGRAVCRSMGRLAPLRC